MSRHKTKFTSPVTGCEVIIVNLVLFRLNGCHRKDLPYRESAIYAFTLSNVLTFRIERLQSMLLHYPMYYVALFYTRV